MSTAAVAQISGQRDEVIGSVSGRANSSADYDSDGFSDLRLKMRSGTLAASSSNFSGGHNYSASASAPHAYSHEETAAASKVSFSARVAAQTSGYGPNTGGTIATGSFSHNYSLTIAQPMLLTLQLDHLQNTEGVAFINFQQSGGNNTTIFNFRVEDETAGPEMLGTYEYVLPRGSYALYTNFVLLHDPRSTPRNASWTYTANAGVEYKFNITVVPEPTTTMLIAGGHVCFLFSRWRREHSTAG